jgi:hypothetical protein
MRTTIPNTTINAPCHLVGVIGRRGNRLRCHASMRSTFSSMTTPRRTSPRPRPTAMRRNRLKQNLVRQGGCGETARTFAELLIDCERTGRSGRCLSGCGGRTEERGDGDALSGKESAADTPTMPFIFILVAFAVVAVLMVIGMRQRWIPGPRGRWIPGARGRWEPGARGGWEPGAQPEPPPLPRAQWVLAVVGWVSSLLGCFWGRS